MFWLVIWLATGCGSAPPPAQRLAESPREEVHAEAPSNDPRALPGEPTFGDVVDAAKRLDDTSATTSEVGCLVGPRRFDADVAVGVRPLPHAPTDLDARLEASQRPVRVLSIWGSIGLATPDLAIAAFTTAPSSGTNAAVIVFLTDRGAYARSTEDGAFPSYDAMSIEDAARAIESYAGLPLFVTAEAEVPVQSVLELLRTQSARSGSIALAVALAQGTQLPAIAQAALDERTGLCPPDGFPEPEASQPGDLGRDALTQAVGSARDRIAACVSSYATTALDVMLRATFRVDVEGRVSDACVDNSAISPQLRACILESIRAIEPGVPSPAGYVDVSVPLHVLSPGLVSQRPTCD